MIDSYGRVIDYLRISVIDRCNLRCVYCMPEEGLEMISHEEILTYGEIVRICKIMAKDGLKKIKLTGGEPLVRKDLPKLAARLKKIPGIEKVTLTTNGVLLGSMMEELHDAGIDSINISLDTLNRELYAQITRRDQLEAVRKGIEAVLAYPDISLKINCVPMGLPEQDLSEVASLAKDHRIHVRFIEMMPIGYGKNYRFTGEDEILGQLEERFGKAEIYTGKLGNGPCHYYDFEGFQGKIGFISAISHKFCSECNRVRLTSQGFLKTCLQYNTGSDLKVPMRTGASDEELRELIIQTINGKPVGHRFLEEEISDENNLNMSQIGG
ncbi:MAG: GTP 3',8-cyclase MoaA [Lachnospiraceae bacterium]|nr:GTP 3',8-cyclase MoaA [Lachnospiraceae bacterium]MDY4970545.1 GTP 3',8-cyclase MoaA [Lachnospiraceae bacterium]